MAAATTHLMASCAEARKSLTAGTRVIIKVMAPKPKVDVVLVTTYLGRTGVIVSAPAMKQGACFWQIALDSIELAASTEQIK